MATTPAKQIIKFLSSWIRLNGLSVTGSSFGATTAITTALSSAGEGGTNVPLQPAGLIGLGVLVTAPRNVCKLYEANSDDTILAGGVEVYGKLTEASGAYTLSFFTLSDAGVETAYSFAANSSIDVEFTYRFDFGRLPSDAITGMRVRSISDDAAASAAKQAAELLTITATNTLPNLTRTPIEAATLKLIVNGILYHSFGGSSAPFAVNLGTKALTWSAANAGFSIETTDRVVAEYVTNE